MGLAGNRERLHSAATFADVFDELNPDRVLGLPPDERDALIADALDLAHLPLLRYAGEMVITADGLINDKGAERTAQELALLTAMKSTVVAFVEKKLAGAGIVESKKSE